MERAASLQNRAAERPNKERVRLHWGCLDEHERLDLVGGAASRCFGPQLVTHLHDR